jgi:hypothetical protein
VIDASFLAWPFFEDRHRRFAGELTAWAENEIHPLVDHTTWTPPAAGSCGGSGRPVG